MQTHILTLDRIEGTVAVFEYSSGTAQKTWLELPVSWFSGAKEGDSFQVTLDQTTWEAMGSKKGSHGFPENDEGGRRGG